MKKNFAKLKNNAEQIAAAASTMLVMAETTIANASTGASGLLEFIIDMIAKGSLAFGAIFGVMGLMKWASAHADGDGPEMKKAQGTLAAAVIVIVISVAMQGAKSTITGIIG